MPKDRSSGRFGNDDLNKQLFQLITQGSNNFIEPPVTKNGKINNIRKWDQAFRVFAAIYMHTNPERASEIWQYVYMIHTAAAANPWENVYFYDINFRELMASKPWRSWGKTYTQGWNMAFNNSSSFSLGNSSYNNAINLDIVLKAGRTIVVNTSTKTSARKQDQSATMTIDVHIAQDGTMGSTTVEKDKTKIGSLVVVLVQLHQTIVLPISKKSILQSLINCCI